MHGLAVACAHADLGGSGPVAIESNHEQAIGRGRSHLLAVKPHLGAGRGPAKGEAALLEPAGKLEA